MSSHSKAASIPGPDPGACPKCGEWVKAGMRHTCMAASEIEWWKKLTPLQRLIVAVLRAAMSEAAEERERKRRYEEAIYGRP